MNHAALRRSELRAAAELRPKRLALLLVLGLELLEHKLAHARLGLAAELRKLAVVLFPEYNPFRISTTVWRT